MKHKFNTLVFCLSAIHAGIAYAGPAAYVYTPTVEHGEVELDFKHGSARQLDGTFRQVSSLGLGYGATEYWFTEVYLKQQRNGNQNMTMAEWENKFQLTETGKYPVELGFVAELEAPLSGSAPWEIKFGPLLQTEFGKIQLNGNLIFERAFGMADETGVPFATNLLYQWQVKYRWQPVFEFGLQGLGELGKWDNWSGQNAQLHSFGPAAFGKFALGNRQAIKYNAAWLIGTSTATPNHTFRTQVEYEF